LHSCQGIETVRTPHEKYGGNGEKMPKIQRYERADDSILKSVDGALQLVQGSFVAAAKLLDLEPQKLRNLVNWNPSLKAKWGKKRGGQRRIGFSLNSVDPFGLNKSEPKYRLSSVHPWRSHVLRDAKRMIMRHLYPDEIEQLAIWLEGLRDQRGKKSNEQQSLEEWKKSEKSDEC
jgi:hypothetical protein